MSEVKEKWHKIICVVWRRIGRQVYSVSERMHISRGRTIWTDVQLDHFRLCPSRKRTTVQQRTCHGPTKPTGLLLAPRACRRCAVEHSWLHAHNQHILPYSRGLLFFTPHTDVDDVYDCSGHIVHKVDDARQLLCATCAPFFVQSASVARALFSNSHKLGPGSVRPGKTRPHPLISVKIWV